MSIDREAFAAWINSRQNVYSLNRSITSDGYYHYETQSMWVAWQAAKEDSQTGSNYDNCTVEFLRKEGEELKAENESLEEQNKYLISDDAEWRKLVEKQDQQIEQLKAGSQKEIEALNYDCLREISHKSYEIKQLKKLLSKIRQDLYLRGDIVDGCTVVDMSYFLWQELKEVADGKQ